MTNRHILLRAVVLVSTLLAGAAFADPVDDYFDKARTHLDHGERKSAVIELKNALQEDPNRVDARLLLGETYLKLGDAEAAEKELGRARDLGATKPAWEEGIGQALMAQGRYGDVLDTIVPDETQPMAHRVQILVLRGRAQVARGDYDKARASFDAALTLRPEDEDALVGKASVEGLMGHLDAAIEAVSGALMRNPDLVSGLMARGEMLRQKQDLDGSVADYRHLVEIDPDNARARIALAGLYFTQNQLDATLEQLDALGDRGRLMVPAVYLRALVYGKQERYPEAEEQVQLILRTYPENARAQLLYGVVSYHQKKMELADDMLTRAATQLPDTAQLAKLIGAARLGYGNVAKAIEVLERASYHFPDDPQLKAMLGAAYLRQGDGAKATQLLTEAVQAAPDLASLRARLAIGLLMQGETRQAIAELQSAVELNPDLIQADLLLVLSHLRQGNNAKALEAALALAKRRPNEAVVQNVIGLALMADKQYDKAKQRFEKAKALDPGFYNADLNLARLALVQGDLDGTEAHFKKVLDEAGGQVQALRGLLMVASQRGDQKAWESWLAEARQRFPDDLGFALLQARHFLTQKQALKALAVASALHLAHPDEPAVLEVLGKAQLAAGQAGNAASSFQSLVYRRPGSAQAYLLLGVAEMANDRPYRARKTLEQAYLITPKDPRVMSELARAALGDTDPARALQVSTALCEAHPERVEGFAMAGKALLALKRPDEGAAMYAKAQKLKPTGDGAETLSALYQTLGRADDAKVVLESWLADHPDDVSVLRHLGLLFHTAKQPDKARDVYEHILELEPNDTLALNNLAWIYLDEGDERALELARKAYEVDPNRSNLVDTYGWIILKQTQDKSRALNLLQQALLSTPYDPDVVYHTAYAMRELGRVDEARKLLERYIAGQGDAPGVQRARDLLGEL